MRSPAELELSESASRSLLSLPTTPVMSVALSWKGRWEWGGGELSAQVPTKFVRRGESYVTGMKVARVVLGFVCRVSSEIVCEVWEKAVTPYLY